MKASLIEKKFLKLPPDKQKEVEGLIDDILKKTEGAVEKKPTKTKPMFGALKGTIIMSDDFDEPLEDFKEYM